MTTKTLFSLRLLLAVIAFCLLPAAPLHAQIDKWGYWQNGVSEPWWFSTAEFKTQEADTAIARWNAIGADQQASNQNWTGDYFRGSEVHGTYVRWSPQSGFVIADIDKCQAKVMRLTYGRVNASATVIEFIPEFRKGSQRHGHLHGEPEPLAPIRFVPVTWRGVPHLIQTEALSDFADLAAGLGNYNVGVNPENGFSYDFYNKLGVEESKVAGELPVFPAGYEQFAKKPIEAVIENIGSRKIRRASTDGEPASYQSRLTVVISAGSADGVKRKMVFRVRDSVDNVEIIQVRRTTSVGVIVRDLDENATETYYQYVAGEQTSKRYPPIVVGWQVTTAP